MEINNEGRTKNKWFDAFESNMRTFGVRADDVQDRVKWTFRI